MNFQLMSLLSFFLAVSITSAAMDSFDNFVLSYGDFERCAFGIGRPRTKKNANTKPNPKTKMTETEQDEITTKCDDEIQEHDHHEDITSGSSGISTNIDLVSSTGGATDATVVHALRDKGDVLFTDQDVPSPPQQQEVQVQTVSSTTPTSSSSSLSSVISIGRTTRRAGASSSLSNALRKSDDGNEFGWGLHQSSGF